MYPTQSLSPSVFISPLSTLGINDGSHGDDARLLKATGSPASPARFKSHFVWNCIVCNWDHYCWNFSVTFSLQQSLMFKIDFFPPQINSVCGGEGDMRGITLQVKAMAALHRVCGGSFNHTFISNVQLIPTKPEGILLLNYIPLFPFRFIYYHCTSA